MSEIQCQCLVFTCQAVLDKLELQLLYFLSTSAVGVIEAILSVYLCVWVCETYVVHHLVSKRITWTCFVDHKPA